MASRGAGRITECVATLIGDAVLLAVVGLKLIVVWIWFSRVLDFLFLRPIWWMAERLGEPLPQGTHLVLRVLSPGLLALGLYGLRSGSSWLNQRRERARKARAAAPGADTSARLSTSPQEPAAPVVQVDRPPFPAPAHPPPPLPSQPGSIRSFAEGSDSPPPSPLHEAPATAPPQLPGCYRPFGKTDEGSAPPPREPRKAPQPKPFELTRAEWEETSDPCVLLSHAIPRIPVRHTCLVLSQLAGGCWPHWNRCFPDDWRPGWFLMVLRGWSLGEANLLELAAAGNAARAALVQARREGNLGPDRLPAYAAVRAMGHALPYARESGGDGVGLAPAFKLLAWVGLATRQEDLTCELDLDAPARRWAYTDPEPSLEQLALRRARRMLAARRAARIADRLRTWIPYPSRRSTQWRRSGNWIRAGEASLFLDGWRIAISRSLTAPPPR